MLREYSKVLRKLPRAKTTLRSIRVFSCKICTHIVLLLMLTLIINIVFYFKKQQYKVDFIVNIDFHSSRKLTLNQGLTIFAFHFSLVPTFYKFTMTFQSLKLDAFVIEVPGSLFGSSIEVCAILCIIRNK